MASTRLLLLGTPRLERDGIPLDLKYRKNVALITYLAVTGQRHTREALLALLWPELEPSRARAGLRRNLSLLRKALGGELPIVDRETVGLDPEADPSTPSVGQAQALWLDVGQFRRLLSTWRDHGHSETEVCVECLTALAEAAALYRGDFMAGFSLRDSLAFDEWQFFQTEELRHELASALERLVRGHSARGAYELALPYARRWQALDPLHEPAHRHLMLLYAQTDQRAAAMRQYEECARILETELGLSPSRETTALYERIRAQPADREVPLSPTPLPLHNLPAQTTPFIGREALLAEIAAILQDPTCRLVSLVGPGGIGKTRLALEAAGEQVDHFRDGVYWVPLAAARSMDSIVLTVAQAAGLALDRVGEPWLRLLEYLRGKRILLVLDNLEHLLDAPHPAGRGAVDLLNDILQVAPDVKTVITSRVRPNVQSECLLPVAGMEYPRENGGIEEPIAGRTGIGARREAEAKAANKYSAVRLFLSYARRVRPGFEPTAEELAGVVQICRLVQGMPLAILMAAAWMEMLSVAEIVAELEQGYALLETNLRDLPDRQHSIEAVYDASWRMLDDAEREVSARLSVFRGGFTREAAEKVAGAGLRALISLVHKSFLQRDPAGRYEMHELLRQYAGHRLSETPEEKERISDLHCRYYADVLRLGMANLERGGVWGLLAEIDNVRAGWHWAIRQVRFAEICEYTGLFDLYWHQGVYQEAVTSLEWAARVLRMHRADERIGERDVALALILINLGRMYQKWDPGERIELRERLVDEGVSILRRLGARRELADIARVIAWTYGPERDAEARQILQESLVFYRERGDLEGIPTLLAVLGEMDVRRGAYDEAERRSQEAIALADKIDGRFGIDYAFFNLAKIAYFRRDYQTARQLYENALAGGERVGQRGLMAMSCSFLGDTALAMGDYGAAKECHQRAQAIYEEMTIYWADATSGQHYGAAHSLVRLGDIALAVGEIEQARGSYRQALQIARDHPCVTLNLEVVVSHAALLAQSGDGQRAVELAALVLHHPAGYVEVKERAQRVLDQLDAELPQEVFVGARGRARDLEATVKELLVELKSESLLLAG